MPIDLDNNLYALWYENEDGVRWVPDFSGPNPPDMAPEGFIYHHAEFPTRVVHDVLKMVQAAEVESCPHPTDALRKDTGLIPGFKGRRCARCGGRQTIEECSPWPEKWDAHGSIPLFSGSKGYFDNLVLAMTRPTEAEQKLAIERAQAEGYEPVAPRAREVGTVGFVHPDYAAQTGAKVGDELIAYGPGPRLYDLHNAVLVSARSCEGCVNVLMWEYGCADGYPYGSEQHKRAGTSCVFCTPRTVISSKHGEVNEQH